MLWGRIVDSTWNITGILGMIIMIIVIIATNNILDTVHQEYAILPPYGNILILQIKAMLKILCKLIQGHKSKKQVLLFYVLGNMESYF